MQNRAATAGVFLAALIVLGWNAGSPGISTSYVDPFAKIQAQDEAYYGSISIDMAARNHWLTPRFLDRYALTKPPLDYWLEASCVKLLGARAIALRLPSIFAGAGTVALVFWWVLAEGCGLWAGLTAAVLLLGSHLFFVVSRIGLTDALLTFETALAMLALARDPRLKSRVWLWTFGLASGAAILTKGLAGVYALLALGLFCVLSRDRPGWTRLLQAVAISAAVALPWHLFELLRHTRWFWAEYVLSEVVTNSVGSPAQSTQDSQLGYYWARIYGLDAVLLFAGAAALIRRRPRAVLAWIAVVIAAMLAFEYRNTTYLTPLLPALAVLAGLAVPKKWAPAALVIALLLFAGKAVAYERPWGLPFGAQSEIEAAPALQRYAAMHRGNDLILGDPNDAFYSACLKLPKVRYLYLDRGMDHRRLALDFEYLGISMQARDFARLPQVRPEFEARLRDWGLYDGDPLATTIFAPTLDSIRTLVHDHPLADFYLPVSWAAADAGVHQAIDSGAGNELLLSRQVIRP